jgi:hypothetical protein
MDRGNSSCRAKARHPRLWLCYEGKSWMPTFVGMTMVSVVRTTR